MAATHLAIALSIPKISSTLLPQQGHLLRFPAVAHGQRWPRPLRAVTADDFLGDFGARDPFPAEIESKFGEKVIGNMNTEHKILIPNISALSLAQQQCTPVSPMQPPLSKEHAGELLRKVVGWKLVENEGGLLKLQCQWKVRDSNSGIELMNRINEAAESSQHMPELQHLEDANQVRAELWTAAIGGLSINDFIVAAKIDQIRTADLAPKKRVWA